jgi:uncharacterized RDD family membrane protein YckC
MEDIDSIPKLPRVYAWDRWLARMIDYSIYIIVFDFIADNLLRLFGLNYNDYFFNSSNETLTIYIFLILFTFMFIEPIMLKYWGTTLGKWILHIHISNEDSSKLTYKQALSRSYGVWSRGLFFGIFILSLFAMIIESITLNRYKITPWDQNGKFIVSHPLHNELRIIIGFFVLAFLASISELIT